MYYVAKTFNHGNPSIVESFGNETLAKQYAEIMTTAGKGEYIVLKTI